MSARHRIRVELLWEPPVDLDTVGYRVFWGMGASMTNFLTLAGPATSITLHIWLEEGGKYEFYVCAFDKAENISKPKLIHHYYLEA